MRRRNAVAGVNHDVPTDAFVLDNLSGSEDFYA